MEFLKNKQNLYILISAAVALALIGGAVFWVNNSKTDPGEKELETIVLEQDAGFDLGGSGLNREVYLRYRLIDTTLPRNDPGQPQSNFLDLSQDNAKVFLTYPDGTNEEVTSELLYVPLRLYPPQPEGEYKLTIQLNSGEVYERRIEFPEPKRVNLVPAGKTRVQEKPEPSEEEKNFSFDLNSGGIPEGFTIEEQVTWSILSETGRDSRTLTAFDMEGVDISQVDYAFYIDTARATYHSEVPGENIDEHFWMDLEYMDTLREGDYIFLAKDGNQWYYSLANYPKNFK